MLATSLCSLGLCALLVGNSVAQVRQERRADRNLRQLDRQANKMINRTDYYTTDVWTQVDPWIQQYKIQTVRPVQETARVVARGAEKTVDRAADATRRALFGFNDANTQFSKDVWFYDYYTYWPSAYTTTGDTAPDYSAAVRYFDYDNDGVYESTYTYRDADRDGRFDEYNRYDFTAVQTEVQPEYSPSDATQHTIVGKVQGMRTSKVNNVDHLILRVAQDDGTTVVVDLGPADQWSEVKVVDGISIKATGPMERIGERDVMFPESVTIGNKQMRVEHTIPSYSGTILEVKKFKVNDAEHILAVIETSNGNQLVDLGPSNAIDVDVVAQEKIAVYGVPVRMQDRQVVMASRFDFGGKTFTVTRWK